MDFKQVLAEKREKVWKEIFGYLPEKVNFSEKYAEVIEFHNKLVRVYPERKGKYLRPTLLILTAEAMGVLEKKTIKTAAAMQLSEDWILTHDDIQDASLERRGGPSLHRMYGFEMAINAGDALHVMMNRILRDNEKVLGVEKTFEIMDEFYNILDRVTLGQTTEMKWSNDNKTDITEEDCLFIIDGKTVTYTIAGPMRLGAILAGATKKQLDIITEFGTALGRAFQIRDDVLDLTSDFEGLKKQVGNDLVEGKRTVMLAHFLKNAGPAEKKFVISYLDRKREKRTFEEAGEIIKMMNECGSIKYAQKRAEEFAGRAFKILETKMSFLKEPEAREALETGIEFIVKRTH
ncbi:MAG: polyprenyl synthetase family protein [Candidatus Micrarchaeota archaeon]